MNFLLKQTKTYNLEGSSDFVKKRLEDLLTGNVLNFSKRYYGTVSEDGRFTFKQKIIFFDLMIFGQSVYLTGILKQKSKGSTITITLSPNLFLVAIVYLLPLLCLNILFGDNSLMGRSNGRLENFIIIILVDSLIFLFIQLRKFFLQRKFEKAIINRDYSYFDKSFLQATNNNLD
jgi:hypothetical protein